MQGLQAVQGPLGVLQTVQSGAVLQALRLPEQAATGKTSLTI